MSTTLQIESFSDANLADQPQSNLTAAAAADATSLVVESTEGFGAGQVAYVGLLSREGCEQVSISAAASATELTLDGGLKLSHGRSEPVTVVMGNQIRIYRAANVDGTAPGVGSFAVLATRTIDAEKETTYYTDSTGSADFWYRYTYFNPITEAETDLDDSIPVRGDDFGHYASVSEIRKEAGFDGAQNLSDVDIDAQRRNAESEINSTLGTRYTVPFSPVPEMVHTLTVQLGAALLWDRYLKGTSKGRDALKDVRARISSYVTGQSLVDDGGSSIATGDKVSSWPDESAYRAFTMEDRF